jgi:AcrR family transcriptional regulator
MVAPVSSSRRERVRAAAVADLKAAARQRLAEGGPAAITLRAIARDMGMTAGAIYRYFASLDALIDALAGDLFDELRAAVEAARDAAGTDDPLARINDMARAFRRWAVAHPSEFGLVFGPRPAGVTRMWADRSEPHESTFRFGSAFLVEFAALYQRYPTNLPPAGDIERNLRPYLGPYFARRGDDIPLPVVFLFLSAWTRLYGLVAMEVFGHARWALTDGAGLFETELLAFTRQLTGTLPA